MRTRVETLTQKKSSWKRQASCALLRQDRYVARQDRDVRLVMLDVSHPHAISAPIVGPSDFDILLDSFKSSVRFGQWKLPLLPCQAARCNYLRTT